MSNKKIKEKNPIGLRLKCAFQELGLKPVEVAQQLGIPAPTVYGWTQGIREPRGFVLERIVREFNINPNYILLGEGPPVLSQDEDHSEEKKDDLHTQIRSLKRILESLERRLTFLEEEKMVRNRHFFEGDRSEEFEWAVVDHVCRECGSVIVARKAKGLHTAGVVYWCPTCGKKSVDNTDICWCGVSFSEEQTYMCLPISFAEKYPEEAREMIYDLFRKCGVDIRRRRVGVVLLKDLKRVLRDIETFEQVKTLDDPSLDTVIADIKKCIKEAKPPGEILWLRKLWRDYALKEKGGLFVLGLMALAFERVKETSNGI